VLLSSPFPLEPFPFAFKKLGPSKFSGPPRNQKASFQSFFSPSSSFPLSSKESGKSTHPLPLSEPENTKFQPWFPVPPFPASDPLPLNKRGFSVLCARQASRGDILTPPHSPLFFCFLVTLLESRDIGPRLANRSFFILYSLGECRIFR